MSTLGFLIRLVRNRRDDRYGLNLDRRTWNRSTSFIVAGLLALGAAGVGFLWWMASADARALAAGAVQTTGQVVDLEAERSNGKTRHIVEVGFADAAGTAHAVRVVVSEAFFAGLDKGKPVPVTYAASDPTAVEVEPGTASGDAFGIAIIAMVLAALSAFFGLTGLLAKPAVPLNRRPPA